MSFPYLNPTNSSRLSAPWSVGRSTVEGTNFSVLGIGGWMEVANLSDLSLTFIGTGSQTYSGNSIPININIGKGTSFSPNALQLHNDNISSGRRRIGMVVYVNETGLSYQYEIDNYETLWSAATASEGTVLINTYNTSVYSNSIAGQNFINAWTGSTIEGVSGTTRNNARWRIFHGTDTFVTGGTYFSATSTIELYRNDGETIPISGITVTGGTSSNGFTGGTVSGATNFTGGLTANTISATTYQNLPSFTGNYLPLSGGTVSGATNFTNDLTITGVNSTSGLTRYLVVDISGNTYHQTAGDMTLGSTQTNSGAKTFLDTTFLLRNVANTFNGSFVNTNTANRIYTLPDAAGTIALTSNLSSYVPYTGATANVNIGANSYLGTKLQLGTPTGNTPSNFTVAIKNVGSDGLYMEGGGGSARILMQAQGLTGGNGQIELLANTNNNSYLKLGLTFLRESSGFLTVSATNFAPTSTLHVRGASATTGNAFLVQNSTPSAILTVLNNGNVGIGALSEAQITAKLTINNTTAYDGALSVGVSAASKVALLGNIEFTTNTAGSWAGQSISCEGTNRTFRLNGSGNLNATDTTTFLFNSGYASRVTNYNAFTFTSNFAPISGTAIHNIMVISGSTNQTSTATGTTRGLIISPTILAATDYRALEIITRNNANDTVIKLNNGTGDLFVVKGDSKIGFFGATPVVKQTLGVTTAGATYTSTEQGMLQRVYDAIRTYGLGT